MSTLLQQNLAKEIVKNVKAPKKKNKKELVVSSGYSEISAESSSHIILEQKGVIDALEDLGFSEFNAKKVVTEIMMDSKKDPNARLKATDQVFKVHGSYKEKDTNISVNQTIFNTKVSTMTPEQIDEFLKAKLNESTKG